MSEILDSDEIRLLSDIGFIAVSRGLMVHGSAIFDAVKALRPEQEAGYLGQGMLDILSGDPASAVEKLKSAPPTDGVRAFLGIALIQVGNIPEGRTMLESVKQEADGTPFARIASDTLETLETV
ncbi:MAG: hypothetical protein AAGE61_14575 [Pseudomonadota bacterium]